MYKIKILEKIEGNGRTARGALDPCCTQYRKSRKIYWIKKLPTTYPYRLNADFGDGVRLKLWWAEIFHH